MNQEKSNDQNSLPVGMDRIDHLQTGQSWTMGLVGLAKWLTWETENVFGKSKRGLITQVVETVLKAVEADPEKKAEMLKILDKIHQQERVDSRPAERYAPPVGKKMVDPNEAQRRMRFFSEDFLNKQFDIFMNLLPRKMVHLYLSQYFSLAQPAPWSIFGNGNEFEYSTGIYFMQMDTVAYCHELSTLVALELKIDADLGQQQILKYCFMTAMLEAREMIVPSQLKILLLASDLEVPYQREELVERSRKQLEEGYRPKKRVDKDEMERLVPRTREILEGMEYGYTSWQQVGDYFQNQLGGVDRSGREETVAKLIEGFLQSLGQTYSRKHQRRLYIPG